MADATLVALAEKEPNGHGVFCKRDVDIGTTVFHETAVFVDLGPIYQRPWKDAGTFGERAFSKVVLSVIIFMKKVEFLVREYGEFLGQDRLRFATWYFGREMKVPARFSDEELLEAMHVAEERAPDADSNPIRQHIERHVHRFFADALALETDVVPNQVFAFSPVASILNHSCRPNAIALPVIHGKEDVVPISHGSVWVRAIRPIKEGEEVTIAYIPGLKPTREEQQAEIRTRFGFTCRCEACEHEERDPHERDLKNVVYGLYNELLAYCRDDTTPVSQVYRKAAHVLDGFDALEIAHLPKKLVYDLCALKAGALEDALRTDFFLNKSFEWVHMVFGLIPCRELTNLGTRIEFARAGAMKKTETSIVGHSTYQAYDFYQEFVEDLMFMMNHDHNDPVYYCLRVVNGKVEEVPHSINKERIWAMLQKQEELHRQQLLGFERTLAQFRSVDDLVEEIEAAGPSEPKKVSKKGRQRAKKAAAAAAEASRAAAIEEDEVVMEEGAGGSDKAEEVEEEVVVVLPASAPFQWTYDEPYVCPFGVKDGISEQQWLRNSATKKALHFKDRDVGCLLYAKDGPGSDRERIVLSGRRDSVSGRIQGYREFVELAGPFSRKERTHSFGNDGSNNDLMRESRVRESEY